MPVFISYSHVDRGFVNELAAHLVKHNAHVWVDSWELNVGDSIVAKVQDAIQESSALLVVLSKASVESEWCKKELNAGLVRELEERRVIVLPVLLEDCTIPIFLRDKVYADFRKNFDIGLKALVEAIGRVTNADQGRIISGSGHVDWSEDWGYEDDGMFRIEYTLIETSRDWPFTLLTEIVVRCNDVVTRRYNEYLKRGLDWLGRGVISEMLVELAEAEDINVLLTDQRRQLVHRGLVDRRRKAGYEIVISCRRMGEDNGKDQLVRVTNYLRQIRNYIRTVTRKPTPEELTAMKELLMEPW